LLQEEKLLIKLIESSKRAAGTQDPSNQKYYREGSIHSFVGP
jgi:hypothetical protein